MSPERVRRALVAGGGGFIGLHLARALVADGVEVTLLDDLSRTGRDDDLAALAPRVETVEWDLTRPLPPELLPAPFDQVFHLAAIVGVAACERHPERVLAVNTAATLNLLDHCARRPPRGGLCFASTSEVYAGAAAAGLAPFPTPEDTPFVLAEPEAPRASYALSKIAGEAVCHHHGRAHGYPVRSVRFHNVYGPRMGSRHAVPQLIERALARADPFAVYGDQRRCFCYVDDAVAATLALMAHPDPGTLTVNVGDDREEISIARLAERVTDLAGYRPRFEVHPAPAGSPQRRVPELSRLRRLTGFEPRVDLATGLERTFRWYAQRASDHDSVTMQRFDIG